MTASSPHTPSTAQTGFTLIELLVATVIGVLVILGATQLFIASQQSYRITTALANMQDTGRFALETLSRELRQVDYKGGCAQNLLSVHVRSASDAALAAPALQVVTGAQAQGVAAVLESPLPNTQSIAFRAATTLPPVTTTIETLASNQQINLTGSVPYTGRLVLLQGLQNCDLFYNVSTQPNRLIKAASGVPGNLSPQSSAWSKNGAVPYLQGQSVTLSAIDSGLYYLGRDTESAGAPSLMRLDIGTPTPRNEVLASNVVALRTRVLVGEQYLAPEALTPAQWAQTRAMRVSLIVQSERTDLRAAPTTIATGNFRDAPFSADDGRLYQAFTTTITLRNRP